MTYAIEEGISTTEITDPMVDLYWINAGKLDSIDFIPGAAGDICVFRDGLTNSAPICFYVKTNSAQRKAAKFFGQRIKLYLDVNASTFTAGSRIIINWYEFTKLVQPTSIKEFMDDNNWTFEDSNNWTFANSFEDS